MPPIISGGGGGGGSGIGLPLGWSQSGVTGEVVAKSGADAGIPVHIEGIPGQDPAGDWVLFEVDDANAVLRFDIESNGSAQHIMSVADTGSFIARDGVSGGGIVVYSDGNGGNGVAFVLQLLNAAPADAVVGASNVALWLDDTPGATKLMVKAKDSGGTVRTAAINLA